MQSALKEKDLKICEMVSEFYSAMPDGLSLRNCLSDAILATIAVGMLNEGDEMPSLSLMAEVTGVGISSIHTAYVQCENFKFITKTQGRRSVVLISKDQAIAFTMEALLTNEVENLAKKLTLLGVSPQEGGKIIRNAMTETEPETPKSKKDADKKPDDKPAKQKKAK